MRRLLKHGVVSA